VALVLAERHLVHQTTGGRRDRVGAASGVLGRRRRRVCRLRCGISRTSGAISRASGVGSRFTGGLGLLIDGTNPLLVLPRTLLRLLERAAERIDLLIDIADLRANEFLCRARRRQRNRKRQNRRGKKALAHNSFPPHTNWAPGSRCGAECPPNGPLETPLAPDARQVPAAGVNGQVLLPCSNLERVPARSSPRLERDHVLVPQVFH